MGRVTNEYSAAATGSPPQVNHFSHLHPLHATPPDQNKAYPPTLCSGCKLHTSGQITYTCTPCAFTLHQSCATLPRLITHPSHPTCNLALITHSSYPEGIFSCDACSQQGTAWSYHCARCDYDIHVTCASKPLKIRHVSHTTCHLDLTFKNPYPDTSGFSCDICRKIGSKQWLYRCHTCGFDVHLDCTTTASAPAAATPHQQPMLQHHYSMNPVNHHRNNAYLTHSASAGQFVGQHPAPSQVSGYGPGSQNVGRVQNVNQPMVAAGGVGNNLMMAAVQSFVEGAFQSVGQAVVQDIISDGGAGGDSGGGAGGDIGGGDSSY